MRRGRSRPPSPKGELFEEYDFLLADYQILFRNLSIFWLQAFVFQLNIVVASPVFYRHPDVTLESGLVPHINWELYLQNKITTTQ